jgi:HlyD family secretion protein
MNKDVNTDMKKIYLIIIAILVLLGLAIYGGYVWLHRLPDYIFATNGRIEAQTVDIATRSLARIIEIPVKEGSLVKCGDVIAKLDLSPMAATLTGAEANVHSTLQQQEEAKSQVSKETSNLELAKVQYSRTEELTSKGFASKQEFDRRKAERSAAEANLAAAKQNLASITHKVDVARAEVDRLKDLLKDTELRSSVEGRVLYKLAEPGEVVQAGGKVVTILDLSDVYMTVFIPTEIVGKLNLMDEARIILDARPDLVIPAYISFVSPEAQFTPRQVETKSERTKMTFRIKARIPENILKKRIQAVKTGVPGLTYVRTDTSKNWPDFLKVSPELSVEAKEDKIGTNQNRIK